MNENPCSNQEIHVLFEHGSELENPMFHEHGSELEKKKKKKKLGSAVAQW